MNFSMRAMHFWSRPIVAIWLFFDADFQRDFERHIESSYPFYTETVKHVTEVKHRPTDRENKSKSPGNMRRLSQNDNCDETPNYIQPVYDTSPFPVTFSDTSKPSQSVANRLIRLKMSQTVGCGYTGKIIIKLLLPKIFSSEVNLF